MIGSVFHGNLIFRNKFMLILQSGAILEEELCLFKQKGQIDEVEEALTLLKNLFTYLNHYV